MGLIYSETYSGNAPVSNTISATSKTVLCDGIKVELVNAGWSVISGSSGSWILESGGNHPNGFQHRLQLNDSGTNCARVRLYSPYTAALYLHLYPNSETYRIIATAYDFWCYSESLSSDNRRFMAFVQPFLPTEVQGSPASITQITAGNGAWDDASFSGSLWRVIGGDQAYNLINGGNHIGQI